MVSLRLLFAFFVLSLAHEEDTSFVEVNQAQQEMSGGWNENPVVNQAQQEMSGGWNENPVVNQAQQEMSGGWNENPVVNQAQQEMSGGWNENPVVNQAQQEMSGGWNENPVVNQALPLAHEEDTSFVEVNQAQQEMSGGWNENPVVNQAQQEMSGGWNENPVVNQAQQEMSGGWNENPVVNQAEQERPSAWKAMKNGVIKNTLKQTETRATDAWKMAQNNAFLKPITEDMSHMWAELTNSTSVTIPHDEDRQVYAWNIGAVIVAALAVLLPMCCCGFCAWARPTYGPLLPEDSDSERFLHTVLCDEVRLMLACPALAMMSGPWTTCAGGAPTWVYILYLPILLRSKWVEYQLMLNKA
eukprot:Skav226875  [mRNA]  locus=scaffold1187:215085:216155:+ [translate_table: standard]